MNVRDILDQIIGDSDAERILAQAEEVSVVDESEVSSFRRHFKDKDRILFPEEIADWVGRAGKVLAARAIDACRKALFLRAKNASTAQEVVFIEIAQRHLSSLVKAEVVSFVELRKLGILFELLGFSEDEILMLGCLPTGWWFRIAFDPVLRKRLKSVFEGIPHSLYLLKREQVQSELNAIRSDQHVR